MHWHQSLCPGRVQSSIVLWPLASLPITTSVVEARQRINTAAAPFHAVLQVLPFVTAPTLRSAFPGAPGACPPQLVVTRSGRPPSGPSLGFGVFEAPRCQEVSPGLRGRGHYAFCTQPLLSPISIELFLFFQTLFRSDSSSTPSRYSSV